MIRGAVLGSGAVHLGLLAALFVVRAPTGMIVGGPDVVQVALLEPTALQATPPRAPAAVKSEPSLAEIPPEKDTGVKLAPAKRETKKPEAQRPEAQQSTEAPALPYAPVGTAGLRGQVSVEAGNFEFTYYLLLVRNQVARNWTPPAGLAVGRATRAVVYFRVRRGGELSAVRLESSSGIEFFDRSALRAVVLCDPLPPLPLGFPGPDLGIHFGFEYAAP
jgi:TonB family protein